MTNDDVTGLDVRTKTMHFFPKGLYKFFKNLKLIHIIFCELKEIHQSDLMPFTNLMFLYISSNDVEVIEEGLFDFNPNLELIYFYESNVIHIDPNVFDNLNKLIRFYFAPIPCISRNIENSRENVLEAIKVVKTKCSNFEYIFLENQLKSLEMASNTLKSNHFNLQLDNLEKKFKNSKFSKFRPLNYKIENLRSTKGCSNCYQMEKLESLKVKLEELSEGLEEVFNDKIEEQIKKAIKSELTLISCPQNDTIDGPFSDFKAEIVEKFEKNDKELAKKFHKMSINFDEKIKGVEKRLMKKFEDILEEKLKKFFTKK
ncbi:hypothetical protein ACKWTF_014291 [Chironomus riparius]